MVHRARQVRDQDFYNFDYLLGMDTSNLEDLRDMAQDLGNSSKNEIGKGVTHSFPKTLTLAKLNCLGNIGRLVPNWTRLYEIHIMGT